MAWGCVARDIQGLPLQLLIKKQQFIYEDLLKEVVEEWQDRVSLELLLSLRFHREPLDLTGSLINVQVYLQSRSHSTEVLSVSSTLPLSLFVSSLCSLSPAAAAAPAVAAAAHAAAAAAEGPDGGETHEETVEARLETAIEAYSLDGDKLSGGVTMKEAAAAGIVLKAPHASLALNSLLFLQHTRIFCFSCGRRSSAGGPPESTIKTPLGGPLVVASPLVLHACTEAALPEEAETKASKALREKERETSRSRHPACTTGSFTVSLVPLHTSLASLRLFVLASAAVSPAAASTFFFCVGEFPSSCTLLEEEREKGEETFEEPRDLEAQKDETREKEASVASLVGAAAQGLRVFILQEASAFCGTTTALSPLEKKHLIFEDLAALSELVGDGRDLSPFYLSVHLRPLGSGTHQQQQQQGISSRGGALLFVTGGVAGDLLQEDFLCLLAKQRMHAPTYDPPEAFRLCYVPEPASAEAAAAGEGLIGENCVGLPVGSTMEEVLGAAREAGASVLHVLPREGKQDLLEERDPFFALEEVFAKDPSFSTGSFVAAFPPELNFSKERVTVTIGLASGGRFAVSNVPETTTTGALLAGVRAAVAANLEETLVRFPTGITPLSLVLLSPNGDRRMPENMLVRELCSFRPGGEAQEEPAPEVAREPSEPSKTRCGQRPAPDVLLQFKFRPLEASEFMLRMQPLRERVLDFRSLVFSPGPPSKEESLGSLF